MNIVRIAISKIFKGGTVCMGTFPRNTKEYAFFIPNGVKVKVGDKVSVRMKKGYCSPIKIRSIEPMSKKFKKYGELCKVEGSY